MLFLQDALEHEQTPAADVALSDGGHSPYPRSYSVSRQGSRSNLRASYASEAAVEGITPLASIIIEPPTERSSSFLSESPSLLVTTETGNVVHHHQSPTQLSPLEDLGGALDHGDHIEVAEAFNASGQRDEVSGKVEVRAIFSLSFALLIYMLSSINTDGTCCRGRFRSF